MWVTDVLETTRIQNLSMQQAFTGAYYVPGTVVGPGKTAGKKKKQQKKNPAPIPYTHRTDFLEEEGKQLTSNPENLYWW